MLHVSTGQCQMCVKKLSISKNVWKNEQFVKKKNLIVVEIFDRHFQIMASYRMDLNKNKK